MSDEKNYAEIAEKYASDVVKGKIPAGKWTIAACRRHLDDLLRQKTKKFEYRFSAEKAAKVCGFIEKFSHIKGRKWAGQLIHLEPWQVFNLACIFGWVRKSDDLRRFLEAYLEIARKNAKSTLAAGVGLYMFVGDDEPGSEVYSGATTEKQALEVFTPARLMAKKAEGFKEFFNLIIQVKNIHIPDSAAKFEPLIGSPGDGASPHCAIIDEFHEHPTPALYDAMDTGMGARDQPLKFIITTSGTNIASPCYEKRDQVIKILQGTFENDRVFGNIYAVDDDDDLNDFEVWKKANPNYGISVKEDYLKAKYLEAKQRPGRQNILYCKHCNRWANASVAWMDMIKWKRCADPTLSLEDFVGKRCIIALDLASKIDVTAKVYLFQDDQGKYCYFWKYYMPEETAELPQNTHFQGWIKEGWMADTLGNVLDYDRVREELVEDTKRFQVDWIAYDPWHAEQLALQLQNEGAPVIKYPNQVPTMSEPMKQIQALAYSRQIRHQGDPVTNWMFSNVVARLDKKDNIFPQKELDQNKIDGPVAAIMATGVSIKYPDLYLTGYEKGIEFI